MDLVLERYKLSLFQTHKTFKTRLIYYGIDNTRQIFREIPFFVLVSDFSSSVESETAGVCTDTSLVRIDYVIVILCCFTLCRVAEV